MPAPWRGSRVADAVSTTVHARRLSSASLSYFIAHRSTFLSVCAQQVLATARRYAASFSQSVRQSEDANAESQADGRAHSERATACHTFATHAPDALGSKLRG